ncbi:restriction endonuclease subunit S [Rahnella sikkimica]|uniref:Type I restriction modification DNA specificity domain-containing protein n=1 Tax=Rahnella sikkimica TaxID=1805933 RepID=A0A2L1UU57_9GAMM|nr:restriction endonuclease subunit S [Rahnella sikkimica]AVF36348.1 hypothetical protein BV494_16040 [Rahnella sikkimica]
MSKIPENWEKTTFEKFISIKHGFAFKSEFFSEQGDYVLLTPGHFYEHGGFRDQKHKTKYYTGDIPNGYILNKGSVLLAMTEQAAGLLGSAISIPLDGKYLHNQRLGLISITDPKRIDLNFIYLIYNSPDVRKQIAEQASGTKVKHTSPDRLRNVLVLLPPLPEQTKIAKILSTWDKAITTTEHLIGNSQQQKKSLMQSLLTGKKRLPGFEGEWNYTRLGEISLLTAGATPLTSKKEYWDGDIPWMNSGEINLKKVYEVTGRITELGLSNSSAKILPRDCLLIALAGQGKTRGTVALNKIELCTNQSIAAAIFNPQKAYAEFIYQNMDSRYSELRSLSGGDGGRGGLNLSILRSVEINLPPLPEQQKIAAVLTAADNEIELLQKKLAFLKQEKAALMQQLLTGKRRVNVETA